MAENLSANIEPEKQGDEFLSDAQRNRLSELMFRWRIARDEEEALSAEEQNELAQLIDAELRATRLRAQAKLEKQKVSDAAALPKKSI
jgi:exonuclease I